MFYEYDGKTPKDYTNVEELQVTKKKKDRGLTKGFMTALKSGVLKPILELVRADNTLDLQIRTDYINIYYRGGNLLKLKESDHGYEGEFDLTGYSQMTKSKTSGKSEDSKKKSKKPKTSIFGLSSEGDVMLWTEQVPRFKHLMDRYITKHPHEEREVQQLIVRENNYGSQAKSTDYFICDIEFAQSAESFRFDMIAAHWPSTGSARMKTQGIGLSFIEVKYGDGALGGTAGIDKHLKDMKAFLSKRRYLQSVASQMKKVFNQKIELSEKKKSQLIKITKRIESFDVSALPEYIFILGNHKPSKSKLGSILSDIDETTLPFKLRFAVGNFMGFGLYDQCIYSLKEFRERFEKGICSK